MINNAPIFKREHLYLYQILKPGTFLCKCATTVKPSYLINDGSKSRFIVNLRVASKEKLMEVLSILGHREECLFEEVKHCFCSGTLWFNQLEDIEFLPTKGETVIATFNNKLQCESITLVPRKELSNFDLEAFTLSQKLLNNIFNKLE
jgi:hypothetical protein